MFWYSNMNVADLRQHFDAKNDAELARKLKKGRSTICEWKTNGIPERTQAHLQVMTNGKLKADLQATA